MFRIPFIILVTYYKEVLFVNILVNALTWANNEQYVLVNKMFVVVHSALTNAIKYVIKIR